MNNFKNFIGKTQIKENLITFINSAKKNKKTLDHVLIFGQPGMGKTTIAKLISKELNVDIKIIQGLEIQSKIDIMKVIYFLREGSILFIDEIHSINKSCFELLYSLMDDFSINIDIGKDGNKKITKIDVPKFTLIGATTLLGSIPNPFQDRFGIQLIFNYYSENEIFDILKHELSNNNNFLTDYEILEIAKNSKGTPRIAKNILKRVNDYKMENKINIYDIFKKLSIYENGLNENDISYIKTIYKNKNISIKTISQILFIDEKTLLNKIEPYLFKINFIEKNNRGRKLTKKCVDFLIKNNLI